MLILAIIDWKRLENNIPLFKVSFLSSQQIYDLELFLAEDIKFELGVDEILGPIDIHIEKNLANGDEEFVPADGLLQGTFRLRDRVFSSHLTPRIVPANLTNSHT